jgi:hypothetical protein
VLRNRVERNRAGDGGGGIRISHLPSTFIDNELRDNTAVGAGGGLDLDNDSSVVRGGIIAGNTAGRGGGVHASTWPWRDGLLQDIVITDNEAWRGGGIHIEDNFQRVTMRGLTITNNVAGHGAGVYITTSPFVLSHAVIAFNRASDDGGAIMIGGTSDAWTLPCTCPPVHATGTISFIAAYANTASASGGGAGLWVRSPDVTVSSSIWSGNTGGSTVKVVPLDDASPTPIAPAWRYNDALPATFDGMAAPTGADGNLAVEPMFMDAAAGAFRLQAASPCIDAGDPAVVDTDGSRADMGRYGGALVTP